MISKKLIKIMLLTSVFIFSACGSSPGDEGYATMYMDIRGSGDGVVNYMDYIVTGYTYPSSVDGMDCYMINVTGSGIASRDSFSSGGAHCTYMGETSPFVSSSTGGAINLTVPTGTGRLIQVIGFDMVSDTCPSSNINSEYESKGDDFYHEIYDAVEIGRTTVDIFSDMDVSISNSYDPNNPKSMSDCKSDFYDDSSNTSSGGHKHFIYVADSIGNQILIYEYYENYGDFSFVVSYTYGVGGNLKSIAVSPGGDILYVAAQNSTLSEIAAFSINSTTGAIDSLIDSEVIASDGGFQFIETTSTGEYAIAVSNNTIASYKLDTSSSVLTLYNSMSVGTTATIYGFTLHGDDTFAFVSINESGSYYIKSFGFDSTTGTFSAGSTQDPSISPPGKIFFNQDSTPNKIYTYGPSSQVVQMQFVSNSFPATGDISYVATGANGGFFATGGVVNIIDGKNSSSGSRLMYLVGNESATTGNIASYSLDGAGSPTYINSINVDKDVKMGFIDENSSYLIVVSEDGTNSNYNLYSYPVYSDGSLGSSYGDLAVIGSLSNVTPLKIEFSLVTQ